MILPTNQATYRIRKFSRKGAVAKNYRTTCEIVDEHTQDIMAHCDVLGHATFSPVSIIDKDRETWTMNPNRKILPTRWILTGPNRSLAVQFDRNLSRKLKNPVHRVILTLLDGRDRELCSVVDPRKGLIDRVLGVGPDDWALMEGDEVVGKITDLARHEGQPKGFWQKLRAFLTPVDKGLVSVKGSHVLSAPVALGMLLILEELTAGASSGD